MEVSVVPHQARLTVRLVRGTALVGFAFYFAWNVYWLAHGLVPVSILKAFTGIPSPTTGGIRSLAALCQGRWLDALLWNPLTLVYLSLTAYSCVVLLRQHMRRQRMVLPSPVALIWMLSLVGGWLAKLLIGSRYW